MRPVLRLLTLALAGAATVSACSDQDDLTDPFAPLNLVITLTPSAVQILVTDTITASDNTQLLLTATSLGFPVATPHAEWSTSTPSVALVDSNGRVQAIGLGVATITARVNGEKATTVVTVAKRVVNATLTPSTFQGLVGDTAVLTATAVDAHGQTVGGTSFVFTSLDPTGVSVTRTGNTTAKITLLKAGSSGVSVLAGGQTAATAVNSFSRDFAGSIATSAPAGALVFSAGEDATCGLVALGRGFCFGREGLVGVAKDTSCFGDGPTGTAEPCTLVPLRIAGALNLHERQRRRHRRLRHDGGQSCVLLGLERRRSARQRIVLDWYFASTKLGRWPGLSRRGFAGSRDRGRQPRLRPEFSRKGLLLGRRRSL